VGYPWYDECIAMVKVTTGVFGRDPEDWDLRVDLSFGPAADYQLEVWPAAGESIGAECDPSLLRVLLPEQDFVVWRCLPDA
jgi:hypothetical protein